jgi:predicted nucleic acid-binding protein
MIVFDASALVEVLLRTEAGRQGQRILRAQDVVAHELVDVEVLAALTNYEKRGGLEAPGPTPR